MSEITRNQAIQIVEDIRTAISAGSVTNTLEARVMEYCVVVLGRRIEETGQSGYIENLPDIVAFLAGFSSPTTLRSLLNAITEKIPAEASRDNKLADKAFVKDLTDALQTAVDTINGKIPAEASRDNKLADKAFVKDLTDALQTAVDTINANIGNGYVYAGIATPSGTPVSGKVFYLARQAGQYTNFGGLTVTEGINILKRNGSAWTQEQLVSMADIRKNPLIGYYECDTAGDTAAKAVTAAGYVLPATGGSVKIKMANRNTVANATLNINSTGAKPLYYNGQRAGVGNTWDTNEIIEVFYDGANYQAYNVAGSNGDGVFDISAYNLTDGKPTPYEDLEAALGPDGNHVPLSLHKGGMSIKFIQGSAYSSDNKYVHYRLMKNQWSINTNDWSFCGDDVLVDIPDWLEVTIDPDGKIIEGIKNDGARVIEGDLQVRGKIINPHMEEQFNSKLKKVNNGVNNEEILSYYKPIVNSDWLEVTIDTEGKIIEGIKNDGTKFVAKLDNPELNDLIKNTGGLTKVAGVSNETVVFDNKSDSAVSEYIIKDIDKDGVYVGYNAPFEYDSVIRQFRIALYGASASDVGTTYDFVIGTIDQRGWLLPRLTISKAVSSYADGQLYFDFSKDKVICNKGDVFFIYAHQTVVGKAEESNNIVTINNNSGRTKILAYTKDILDCLTYITSQSISSPDAKIYFSIISVDSIFATLNVTDDLKKQMAALVKSNSNKQNAVLEDRVTGEKYRLYIVNGQIALRSNRYSRMLCIGNSFTWHTYYQNTWPHTAADRSMAASTDACMYASHLENVIGCTVDRNKWDGRPGITIERTLMDSDFTVPNNDQQYDAVILQLGENIISRDAAEIKETFVTMYRALKTTWPSADIFGVFGAMWGYRSDIICQSIVAAAEEENVPIIDCSLVSFQGQYWPYDYVTDINGNMFELTNEGVYGGHPSDVGMYNIAEAILNVLGYGGIPNRKFNITKNQSAGGVISTPADFWISGGVVTVRCTAQSGYDISSLIVVTKSGTSVEATKRIGVHTSYTFIMPADDVIITPLWEGM